jgi:indolepyruvate ferredoxin oxidoreductase alpha subunit
MYTGVRAGLVIFVADDPEGWSSVQSEQDSRYYARMGKIPTLEPSNPQEALEFTKLAFKISEEFEIPVILRATTKVSHSIGTINLGNIKKANIKGSFEKDSKRYDNLRPNLQKLHAKLEEKIEKIEEKYGCKLNQKFKGQGDVAVIASGVSFEYAKEAFSLLEVNPPFAKIALSYPLSREFVSNLIKDKKEVLVLEELDPIIENFVCRVAKDENPDLIIHGKNQLPTVGEYNFERIVPALEVVLGKKLGFDFRKHQEAVKKACKDLPPRKPVFCAGCPHGSTLYAVKKVFGDDVIYAGDIGCYMLGIFEPFNTVDFIICMGASLGLSHGISRVSDQEVIAFIGDSTFFHAGMPELLNYRFNDDRCPLVVVMDNSITAMTGLQPHPGSGFTGMGDKVSPVKIDDVARAFGAEVKVADSFDQDQLISALEYLKEVKGPRVLVSRGECALLTRRRTRAEGIPLPGFEIDNGKIRPEDIVVSKFPCPAIEKTFGKEQAAYRINPELCSGCGVCKQIFPDGAVKPKGGRP